MSGYPWRMHIPSCGRVKKDGVAEDMLLILLTMATLPWFQEQLDWQRAIQQRGSLNDFDLNRGIAHAGDRRRLWRVLSRFVTGDPVHVSIVGGSISAGSTLGIQHRHAQWLWHGKLFSWLNATFPNAGHRRFNGAVPASTPGYVTGCLSFHAPPTTDLVIVEYSVNSPDSLEYERLVRRLLRYPREPAVILLHMYKFWPAHKGRGFLRADDTSAISQSDLEFGFGEAHIESAANEMAQLYGLSSISLRNAIFHKVWTGCVGAGCAGAGAGVECGMAGIWQGM